jgi:hypothetical protein
MQQPTVTTTLKRYLTFPFQGAGWTGRLVTGSALVLASYFVPFVPMLFAYGYTLRIMQQTMRTRELSLPAWTDWGKLGVDGVRVTVIGVAYALPGLVVLLGGWSLQVAIVFLWPTMAAAFPNRDSATSLLLGLAGITSGIAVVTLSTLLGLVLIIAGMMVLPAATAHFVARDQVAAAFRVREWWPLLRKNKTGYLSAWVIALGLAGAIGIALNLGYYTIVLCCLTPFISAPLYFYVMVVSAALFGETYRDSTDLVYSPRLPTAE